MLFGVDYTRPRLVDVLVQRSHHDVMIEDLNIRPYVDISSGNPTWVNANQHRQIFKGFPEEDNVRHGIQYVACFEGQPTDVLLADNRNYYIDKLTSGTGEPWYGNILVLKSAVGRKLIFDMTVDDIDIAKRCALM